MFRAQLQVAYHTRAAVLTILSLLVPSALMLSIDTPVAAAADITPPTIQSARVTPKSVPAGETALIFAQVTDDNSGVVAVDLSYRISNAPNTSNSAPLKRIAGTSRNGVWTVALSVPFSAPTSQWTIVSISARDAANNITLLSQPDPILDNCSFAVIDNGLGDANPPVIQSLSASPNRVGAGSAAMINIRITDDLSGVATVLGTYKQSNNPNSSLSVYATRISGTPLDGIWQIVIQIPASTPNSTWTVLSLSVTDGAGNVTVANAPSELLDAATFIVSNIPNADPPSKPSNPLAPIIPAPLPVRPPGETAPGNPSVLPTPRK